MSIMVITPGGRGRSRKFSFTNSSVSCCVIRFDLSRSRYSPLGTNLLTPRKERPSMKTKSVLLRSVSVVLALLVFVALPSSTLAVCSPAHDVAFYVEYGPGTTLYLDMETDCPPTATIFYTTNGATPTHIGPIPGPSTAAVPNGTGLSVPYGTTVCVKALAWRSGSADSGVTQACQHNPDL